MPNKLEDITLEDLEKTDRISIRAFNICKKSKLKGLNDIITFYRKYGSFKNLENCGDKTEKELLQICEKFSNHSMDVLIEVIREQEDVKKLVKQFTNDEIELTNKHIEHLIFKLSVRAKNGLQSLFNRTPQTLELIDKIFLSNFSFRTIRNIGEKTVRELDDFKKFFFDFLKKIQLQDNNSNNVENIPLTIITHLDENFVNIINDFNPFKKAALNRHIEYLISNLKVRARNGIIQYFGEAFSTKEIIETVYSYSFHFQNIKNIGSKSVSELNDFKADISSFIKTLRFIEDGLLSREYAKLIVKTTFSNFPVNFNDQFESVFDKTGKIKLFKLIYFLIENGHILKQKEKQLFYFLYTEDCTKSLEQIAIELDLGKERLRQIKINFEDEVQEYFRFILNFNSQDLAPYDISTDVRFKVVNNDFAKKINIDEGVKFNVLFYGKIFGLFLENSHSVLGDDENISGKGNYSNTIRYKNCYLIQKTLFQTFNFETFANDVSVNLSHRITDTYALHFEGYLLYFITAEGKKYLSSIKEICETIIYSEFDLVVNNEGYIVFERNVRKTLPEYTFEILEELGEMTKVEDIAKAINKKYPELDITEQSIRSSLQRNRDMYIYIGRTSTYGLKKWEIENENLRGGTIRDIAEEYLGNHDTPQHTYDIVNYVKHYRDTSSESIFRNIQAEDKNRFMFFKGGYIGLKNKRYAPSDTVFKRVAGTNFRKEVLKKFNGWNYEKVVTYYVNTYNYKPVQIISLFDAKIETGEIILNDDNTLTI